MARGTGDDDTWRPSNEDVLDEYEDEILEEEELEVEKPKGKESTPSRASPPARRKKAAAKSQDEDGAWKPTDEDIEDEELEVQEMLNHQLLDDEIPKAKPKKASSPRKSSSPRKKPTSPRKKPVGRPAHQDDDTWKPAGEDVEDEEELEEEDSPYEDSADDEPTGVKRTPPRKAKKRPATSSAGSPLQHRSKPAKISPASPEEHKVPAPSGGLSPKHRLTSATNRKPPEFLVKGQNDKAPFTFAAYRGEGMVMLAMNWKNGTPPDDFVGWVIEYTEPQSSKCE